MEKSDTQILRAGLSSGEGCQWGLPLGFGGGRESFLEACQPQILRYSAGVPPGPAADIEVNRHNLMASHGKPLHPTASRRELLRPLHAWDPTASRLHPRGMPRGPDGTRWCPDGVPMVSRWCPDGVPMVSRGVLMAPDGVPRHPIISRRLLLPRAAPPRHPVEVAHDDGVKDVYAGGYGVGGGW